MDKIICYVCNEEINGDLNKKPHPELYNAEICGICGNMIHDGCCIDNDFEYVCFKCEGISI